MIDINTYSSPKPFKGINIPLPLQSLYLRNYCDENGLGFMLPKVEWSKDGVYRVMETLLEDRTIKTLAMTSILMIPKMESIRARLMERNDILIHFPLENICKSGIEVAKQLEENDMMEYCASKKETIDELIKKLEA